MRLEREPARPGSVEIPNSLKALAIRMITLRLKDYIEMEMSPFEKSQADADRSYLNRINDDRIRFEEPDTPAGSAEMQPGNAMEVASSIRRELSRERTRGL